MTTGQTTNDEGRALFAAIDAIDPAEPTACRGWTAHDLVAHLAAGAKELADLIEAKLEGRPDRPTRPFEEREAPFRAMAHDELIGRLGEENRRKRRAYEALSGAADPSIAFTGTRISAGTLGVHSRGEAAIHRWDLVGDDELNVQLLSRADLTAHAVWVLNAMPVLDESAPALRRRAGTGHRPTTIAFRTEGPPDVVLHLGATQSRLELAAIPLSWPRSRRSCGPAPKPGSDARRPHRPQEDPAAPANSGSRSNSRYR